jgi:hypothetical protein
MLEQQHIRVLHSRGSTPPIMNNIFIRILELFTTIPCTTLRDPREKVTPQRKNSSKYYFNRTKASVRHKKKNKYGRFRKVIMYYVY